MIEDSRVKRIHFVGIGGSGMSGIAEVLHNMGFVISGSDLADNETVGRLRKKGMKIAVGHDRAHVRNAEAVVYSSAIRRDNVEIVAALERRIPVIPRAEMLAELMRMKYSIAVGGTHGKTTTTSMIAGILTRADFDPTFVVGGKLKIEGSGAKLGSSKYLVAEADESDGSFLKLLPTVAVITNIENDHLEHYGRMGKLRQAFAEFANKVPFYGSVVLNHESPQARRIIGLINKKIILYGLSSECSVRAVNVRTTSAGSFFRLVFQGRDLGEITLGVGGLHNVSNSLAAIAVALELGIPLEDIRAGLESFLLPERRFQVLYNDGRRMVVDDYAHHPTEIKATIDTLIAGPHRRIFAVFQPHRYTRLQILMKQFASCFRKADWVIVTRLYSANQLEIPQISGRRLADLIRQKGHPHVRYLEAFGSIAKFLEKEMGDGDAVVFLSAGNLTQLAHEFADALKQRNS
jgi:UDP-N-acetylmuramate--alanine ligase